MVPRKSDIKNYIHQRRQRKKRKGMKNSGSSKKKRKQVRLLAQQEVITAVQTIPAQESSREADNEETSPRNYPHHRVRKAARHLVDSFFDKTEEKVEKDEIDDPQVTPTPTNLHDF
jgi:hypothetical protein